MSSYYISCSRMRRTETGTDTVYDDDDLTGFATVDDAMDAARKWLATEKPATTCCYGQNIGGVEYSMATVFSESDDEGFGGFDNLTNELETAFNRAQYSYHWFLDHEDEGYDTVTDVLSLMSEKADR